MRPVNSVKGLIQKQAQGPRVVDPRRAILVERGVVPQQGQEVGHDEHEARQRDEVGRHAHREALDDDMCVKWLQHVFGRERPVHPGVLVLLERRELALADVNHLGLLFLFFLPSLFPFINYRSGRCFNRTSGLSPSRVNSVFRRIVVFVNLGRRNLIWVNKYTVPPRD